MSAKRTDHQGRILRTGESQRKDLLYQYRYTDHKGVRRTVYSPSLQQLRIKEKEIALEQAQGIDYRAGTINVVTLVEQYITTKQNVTELTRTHYRSVIGTLQRDALGARPIKDIKMFDAKQTFVRMQQEGRRYSTIAALKGVLRPAFDMAVQDDILRKNPWDFTLSSVIFNDTQHRTPLTKEQQKAWLDFVRHDKVYARHYAMFSLMIETGLRVGELCGITTDDIDMKKGVLYVNKQLHHMRRGYVVGKTKTSSSERMVPITKEAACCIEEILARRPAPSATAIANGHSSFLILNDAGNPMPTAAVGRFITNSLNKYNKKHPDKPLPNISPHILRHTFCTNLIGAGIDIKTLQYLMGHATVNMTLNIYAHVTREDVITQMGKVAELAR